MNIKTRLSFQFTFIVVTVILFFSALVYYFSYSSQVNKFRQNLLDRAKNTAVLLINVSEVDSTLLKKIHQSTISLENEEIAVTDSALNVLYGNNIRYLTGKTLQMNAGEEEVKFFFIGEKDGVCFRHYYSNISYMVYVMAYDKSRRVNLSDLRNILFWSVIFSIWLSVLFAYFFSQRAIEPISRIIRSVKEISSSRLNNRLDEGNRKDEIAQLAMTFNQILTNLEISFKSQQDFVSNASHELRTPISVLISESDYVISRKRTSEEYVSHISGQIADLKKLNSLLNSLLELAQLNSDKTMAFTTVRVDEIVYNAIFQIKNKYHGRKIVPRIHYPENERLLNIKGNDGLLSIAFSNLLDNACKFSTEDVDVEFIISDDHIRIRISDKGIGIPADELKSVYTPFKRASNVKYIGGFGLGLSLVKKIFDLHDAEMRVQSSEDNGTLAEVIFKSFKNPE